MVAGTLSHTTPEIAACFRHYVEDDGGHGTALEYLPGAAGLEPDERNQCPVEIQLIWRAGTPAAALLESGALRMCGDLPARPPESIPIRNFPCVALRRTHDCKPVAGTCPAHCSQRPQGKCDSSHRRFEAPPPPAMQLRQPRRRATGDDQAPQRDKVEVQFAASSPWSGSRRARSYYLTSTSAATARWRAHRHALTLPCRCRWPGDPELVKMRWSGRMSAAGST